MIHEFLFVDSGPCPEWDTSDDCCTNSNKCGIGRGNCDSDMDCKWGLTCGKENCPSVFNNTEYGCCQPLIPTTVDGIPAGRGNWGRAKIPAGISMREMRENARSIFAVL